MDARTLENTAWRGDPVNRFNARPGLFLEYEVYGQDQKNETDEVIPTEGFGFEKQQREKNKHHQGNHLLNHF